MGWIEIIACGTILDYILPHNDSHFRMPTPLLHHALSFFFESFFRLLDDGVCAERASCGRMV